MKRSISRCYANSFDAHSAVNMIRSVVFGFILSICQCVLIKEQESIYERFNRLKRDSQPGVLTFGQNQNANVAPLSQILSNTNIGQSSGGRVDVLRPSGAYNRNTDILGLFSRQQGVEGGVRPGNNVGASWGNQNNAVNGLLGWGNQNNVNFNGNNGALSVQRQKGVQGIYTETDNANVNPLALQFGNQKQKCFGAAFFGGNGICATDNKGFGRS